MNEKQELRECGKCKHFDFEDADGYGYCNEHNDLEPRCDWIACQDFTPKTKHNG